MVEGKTDYASFLPIVIGVGLSAWIFRVADIGLQGMHIAAGAMFTAVCISVTAARKGHELWLWSSMVLCGAFCYASNAVMCSGGLQGGAGALAPAAEACSSFLLSIPFSDASSNALLSALLTGNRSAMDAGLAQAFRDAGAAHLLALSGMHLGIIYIILDRLGRLTGNRPAAANVRRAAIICITLIYTLACGASPSLVRAWLFILISQSGLILGRPQPLSHTYCLALAIQLVANPAVIHSLGFQLSYLAMTGIVFVWPRIRPWFEGDGVMKRIWDAASLSICCQLFTAPLTLWHFGTFPRLFLITNLVAAPLLGIVIGCGLLASLLWSINIDAPWIYTILEAPIRVFIGLIRNIAVLSR